jgi:hypothetical protein
MIACRSSVMQAMAMQMVSAVLSWLPVVEAGGSVGELVVGVVVGVVSGAVGVMLQTCSICVQVLP